MSAINQIRRHADNQMRPAILRQGRPIPGRRTPQPVDVKQTPSRSAIRAWMTRNKEDYRDGRTGEINLTALVEGWDCACADGGATLDSDHIAWDVATTIK